MAADLEFRIGAELTEIKGALAGLQRDFAKVGAAAQQAGGAQAFQGVERGATRALGAVGRLVASFATLAGTIALIGKADELNTLNARLRLVTSSTEEFNRAQQALFELAQRTRSSLGETINLYSRIAQATKDAGVGQETLLQVVETINQAVQLSGSSAQAAEAALVQLGQGLASGTLRGEELNSVLEQTPALADAIAKGMGITRGELRKYGEEGKITAQQVVSALQAQREEVARQFATLPLTVGQATTLLSNASLQLLGAFNESTGATAGLAAQIKDLADFISSDAVIGAVIEFAAVWSEAFRQIADDAREAVRIIAEATTDITGAGENLFTFIGRAFRELPVNVRAAIKIATIEIAAFVDSTITSFRGVAEYIRAVFDPNRTVADVRAALLRSQSAIEGARQDAIGDALRERDAALDAGRRARADAQRARESGRRNTGANGRGNFRPQTDERAAAAALAAEKARLDGLEKLAADAAKRQGEILREQFDDGLLAAADYYARRQQIELDGIERAIEAQRALAAIGSPADRQKALVEIELLERQKADVRRRVARDAAQEQRDLDRQLEQARAQELENGGRTADATRIRLEAQYRDLLKRLEAEGNAAGVKIIRGLIDTGVAKAQFDELQREFERVTGDLQRRQAQIADQVRAGSITPDVAQQQGATARQQAIEQLQRLNEQMQRLAEATNDPAIIAGAQRIGDALRDMAAEGATGLDKAVGDLRASLANMQANFEQTLTSSGVDALTNLFTDLASGSKSAGDSIRDFARSFVASMAQIAARALATYLVLQLLETIFPGIGRTLAATGGGIAANVRHGGGMAGQGPRRQVNPLVFAGAPRFHSGSGVLGLKPGEIPAILQEGERVQSRDEVRAGQQGGGNGVRVVNVLDPSLVAAYLESAAGERVVMNVIERNPAQVRQSIGA